MIEAFWSRMQVELLDTRRWKTRVELANAIFEYIEVFHNRRRRHSSLGMRTPIEFELKNINTTTGQPESRNATPPNRGYCKVSTKTGAFHRLAALGAGRMTQHPLHPPVAQFGEPCQLVEAEERASEFLCRRFTRVVGRRSGS